LCAKLGHFPICSGEKSFEVSKVLHVDERLKNIVIPYDKPFNQMPKQYQNYHVNRRGMGWCPLAYN